MAQLGGSPWITDQCVCVWGGVQGDCENGYCIYIYYWLVIPEMILR